MMTDVDLHNSCMTPARKPEMAITWLRPATIDSIPQAQTTQLWKTWPVHRKPSAKHQKNWKISDKWDKWETNSNGCHEFSINATQTLAGVFLATVFSIQGQSALETSRPGKDEKEECQSQHYLRCCGGQYQLEDMISAFCQPNPRPVKCSQ